MSRGISELLGEESLLGFKKPCVLNFINTVLKRIIALEHELMYLENFSISFLFTYQSSSYMFQNAPSMQCHKLFIGWTFFLLALCLAACRIQCTAGCHVCNTLRLLLLAKTRFSSLFHILAAI